MEPWWTCRSSTGPTLALHLAATTVTPGSGSAMRRSSPYRRTDYCRTIQQQTEGQSMAIGSSSKRERFEARLPAEQKAFLEHAAALNGQTLTDFILSSAQRAAEQTVREREVLVLSAKDSRAFVEALLNPPAPNAALRRAADRYRATMGNG